MAHILVDKNIDPHEECIRCVMHPFMIHSNGRLRREVFMPRPGRDDVSLLRLRYSGIDFCIVHGKKIENSKSELIALASITSNIVDRVNVIEENLVTASIKYSPMHNNDYLPEDIDVYTDEYDLPMHTDLKYSEALPKEDGAVKTGMRRYADILLKYARCAMLADVNDASWRNQEEFDKYK